jgi:hypothetical protein
MSNEKSIVEANANFIESAPIGFLSPDSAAISATMINQNRQTSRTEVVSVIFEAREVNSILGVLG